MKRLISTVSITLALAGGLRWVIGPTTDNRRLDRETFWRLKTHPGRLFDGIIVGDSRMYRGLSPAVMESELKGLSLHNLGYSSGRLAADLFDHAEGLLDPHSPTPFLILGLNAHALSKVKQGPPNPQLAQYLDVGDWEQRLDRWARPLTQGIFQPLVEDPTVALQMAQQSSGKIRYHQYFDARGFVASFTEPADPNRALKSYQKTLVDYPMDSGVFEVLLDRILRWRKAGIRVFALQVPVPKAMAALERSLGGYNEAVIRQRLNGVGAQWLDIETGDLTSYDGSHLDPESARKLSRRVSRRIARMLSPEFQPD